jgi:sulfite exporter TauE/SafE
MIWGWLPCGLVYTAFALAATTGDIIESSLTMLFFGLGTLPAVFGTGIMGGIATRLSRMDKVKQAAGLFLIVLAMLAAFSSLSTMR